MKQKGFGVIELMVVLGIIADLDDLVAAPVQSGRLQVQRYHYRLVEGPSQARLPARELCHCGLPRVSRAWP